MPDREPTRRGNRRPLAILGAGLLILVVMAAAPGRALRSPADDFPASSAPVSLSPPAFASRPATAPNRPARPSLDGPDEADGVLPDRATLSDAEYPGIANLDPSLLRALRRAAKDAADDQVDLFIDSGWRSPAYQERLLREAISRYGSATVAARWVATPKTSPHVSGDAVDIGPAHATAWLSAHGAKYGLCQIYRNEPWHYELRPRATEHGCPRMYADPTHDPRMDS